MTSDFRRRAILIAADRYGTACKRLEVYLQNVPSLHSERWTQEMRDEFDRLLKHIETAKQRLLLIASRYKEPLNQEKAA